MGHFLGGLLLLPAVGADLTGLAETAAEALAFAPGAGGSLLQPAGATETKATARTKVRIGAPCISGARFEPGQQLGNQRDFAQVCQPSWLTELVTSLL